MATKSVADKLLIKPNSTVWLSHPDRLRLIAVDDVWSAMRFRSLKPGEAPFNPGG